MDAPITAADEVVEICADLIRFDTSNFGPEGSRGEREAAEYVAAKLAEVGIDSELLESDHRRTTLVATWAPSGCDGSLPPLLIHGHTDVVPAIAEDWTVAPFSGDVVDGYLWGRGAVDMKDFDAIVVAVVRQRQREGRAPRRPIRLVFTADEEAGGRFGSVWLAEHHRDLIGDCTEAIGEVGGFSLTVNQQRLYLIQTAEKGLAWLKLIAEGAAGHGSMRNDDNAITEIAQAVTRIGAYQWPQTLRPSVRQFLATLDDVLETPIHTDDPEQSLARLGAISRMVGATLSNTANPTMLDGGYKVNVIPGQATAGIDGRFLPGEEQAFFDTIAQLIGDKVRYEVVTRDIAVETRFEGALVSAISASLRNADPDARVVPFMMSAGTDAKAWSKLGISCFGFAPLRLPPELDFSALFHGVDERVPVESLHFGCQVLDDFLDRA